MHEDGTIFYNLIRGTKASRYVQFVTNESRQQVVRKSSYEKVAITPPCGARATSYSSDV